MSDLDALLAGIVADPANALRWLVMADWLEDHGQPERAELVRVHRELLRTCTATRETKARKQLHARMMELMRSGVQPCVPQKTLALPGGVKLKMSFIPPGTFLMGSPRSEKGRNGRHELRHLVTLTKSHWLGQTPVTQAQWRAVMGTEPSHFKGDELPVETVSWDDAQAFCSVVKERTGLDARLPTEAEWEYAARAGTRTPFYWGVELNGTQANCDGRHPFGTAKQGPDLEATTAVGQYSPLSPHPWRLSEVIGNVWEWCVDGYERYPSRSVVDPVGPWTDDVRLLRGGNWMNMAVDCRAAHRAMASQDQKWNDIGFRLAATSSGS
jgi:formylglycine-generating enzyme